MATESACLLGCDTTISTHLFPLNVTTQLPTFFVSVTIFSLLAPRPHTFEHGKGQTGSYESTYHHTR